MLSNEWTKTRRATPPDLAHVLHLPDQLYGVDPSQTNPMNPPQPALTYQDLNKDVTVATNEGLTDGDIIESGGKFCYSPAETLSKSKQEKLSDSLDESQSSRLKNDLVGKERF